MPHVRGLPADPHLTADADWGARRGLTAWRRSEEKTALLTRTRERLDSNDEFREVHQSNYGKANSGSRPYELMTWDFV